MQSVSEISHHIQSDKLLHKMPSFRVVKQELRWASQYLSRHQMHLSSKWASELLLGISTQEDLESHFLLKTFILNNSDPSYKYTPPPTRHEDPDTEDVLTLAKTLLNLKEYKKCTHTLESKMRGRPSNTVIFFYYYSKWMTYQIRKEQEFFENEGQTRAQMNPDIISLDQKLKQLYNQSMLEDVSLYLYGLVLKQQEKFSEAKVVFMEVLNAFPCFWSCWVELLKILINEDTKSFILNMKDHWMKNFFFSSFYLEKYKNNINSEVNFGLFCFFKNSTFLMNQIAHCFYNSQQFDVSLDWFEKLVTVDPYRVESMDTYSNILYIKEKQGELANLAVKCFYNNKYTPESCCVVGNYYSLIGEHNKAISNFRKALKLDKNCLGAWTLMGHECLELKNIPGAIQAYRGALEIDPKDFRAWYGLGQTYELQKMNNYALYYFTKAVMARPTDSRMWNAIASCYESIDKKAEALQCFERAQNCKDREGIAIYKLGRLYSTMGEDYEPKAIEIFELNLLRKEEENIIDKEVKECLLYLIKYYTKIKNHEKVSVYTERLSQFEGPQRDQSEVAKEAER